MVSAPLAGLVGLLFALVPLALAIWILVVLHRLVNAVEGIQGTLDYLVPRLVAGRDDSSPPGAEPPDE